MRIALIEDDKKQRALMHDVLVAAGHVCHGLDQNAALSGALLAEAVDMLICQEPARGADAPALLRWVRTHLRPGLPVLIIGSNATEDELVALLAVGADDYLIKPLRRGELVTRVGVLMRQAYPADGNDVRIEFDDFAFDLRAERLKLRGKSIALTQKEFKLALLLFRHLGRPLSRAFIIETVWSRDIHVSSRTVDTHISRIRSRLDLRTERGYRLAPVYGYGYRLEKTRP